MAARKSTTPAKNNPKAAKVAQELAAEAEERAKQAEQDHPVLQTLRALYADVRDGHVKGFAYVQYGTKGEVVFGHAGLTVMERSAAPSYMMQHHLTQETQAMIRKQQEAEAEANGIPDAEVIVPEEGA